jgi:hypothetical protein
VHHAVRACVWRLYLFAPLYTSCVTVLTSNGRKRQSDFELEERAKNSAVPPSAVSTTKTKFVSLYLVSDSLSQA